MKKHNHQRLAGGIGRHGDSLAHIAVLAVIVLVLYLVGGNDLVTQLIEVKALGIVVEAFRFARR